MHNDAGLLPVAQFDRRWDYTARMAACLDEPSPAPTPDPRQAGRVPIRRHERVEMLRQRLFGVVAGYEDCNDHDTLRTEPVFKMAAGRPPEDEPLASQPTLSRFENAVTCACLQRLADFLIATGIERLKEKNGGTLPASVTDGSSTCTRRCLAWSGRSVSSACCRPSRSARRGASGARRRW